MTTEPVTLVYLLFFASLNILIFVIDLENQIIPDIFVFSGLFIIFTRLLMFTDFRFYELLLGGFVAGLVLLLINMFTKGKGMGLGDVKFAVFGGMLLGYKLVALWLLISFFFGALVGILLILLKRAGIKDKIAFGPFLIFGLVTTYAWGDIIFKYLFRSI